jgi:hypothetical protein
MGNLLVSLFIFGIVCTGAIAGTQSFYSNSHHYDNNSEHRKPNLQIGYKGYCNKSADGNPNAGSWSLKDLRNEKFFNFDDIKPGDYGSGVISLKVDTDSWVCFSVKNLRNKENSLTDPEKKSGDTTVGTDSGELGQNLYFTAWTDNGNGVWENGETLLFSNRFGSVDELSGGTTFAVADFLTKSSCHQNQIKYVGLKWCAGTMTIDEGAHTISCSGTLMGNISQSDTVSADMVFYTVASKDDPKFTCNITHPPPTPTRKPTPTPTKKPNCIYGKDKNCHR